MRGFSATCERPEYRFGYFITSRRSLKELCREQRIEESSFRARNTRSNAGM